MKNYLVLMIKINIINNKIIYNINIKMNKKFLLIILILIIIIILYTRVDNFESNDNLFYQPTKNIFLNDNYLNYNYNKPKPTLNYSTLGEISYDSYIYSDIVSQRIICSNYNNQADCWQNNHCQWIYKIDDKSYCNVAPKFL